MIIKTTITAIIQKTMAPTLESFSLPFGAYLALDAVLQ